MKKRVITLVVSLLAFSSIALLAQEKPVTDNPPVVSQESGTDTAQAEQPTEATSDGTESSGEDKSGSTAGTAAGTATGPSIVDFKNFINSASGSFSYAYPLNLPPGRLGVAPALALNYSSAASNGILGMGFVLSGIPAIERDLRYTVAFNENDRYTFMGQQLVYLSADSSFHPERETFDRIQAYGHGIVTNNPNTPDSYWVLTKKDGTQYFFGSTADSRIDAVGMNGKPRLWALSKVIDVHGNYYQIEYAEDTTNGDYYPVRITYTKNDGYPTSSYFYIEFFYETRNDFDILYQPTLVKQDLRLKWITVKAGATSTTAALIRKYRITYEIGTNTGRSRIKEIVEYGSDGNAPTYDTAKAPQPIVLASYAATGSTLPGVQFTWTDRPKTEYFKLVTPADVDSKCLLLLGDFDGDGKTDYLRQGKNEYNEVISYFDLHISNGDGTFKIRNTISESSIYTLEGRYISDFNGDGKIDVMRHEYSVTQGGIIKVYLSDGSGNFSCVTSTGQDYQNLYRGMALYLGDFDGDGKTDFFCPSNNYIDPLKVYLSKDATTDGKFVCKRYNGNEFLGLLRDAYIILGDFDGNGMTDFLRVPTNVIDSYGIIPSSTISVFLAKGDGSFTCKPLDLCFPQGTMLYLGDSNGDGKTDLFVRTINTNTKIETLQVYISKGDGTFDCSFPAKITFQSLSTTAQYIESLFFGDFNGDGKTDFLCRGKNQKLVLNSSVSVNTSSQPIITLPTLVTTITKPNPGTILPVDRTITTSSVIQVYYSRGDGTFTSEPVVDDNYQTFLKSSTIYTGDFNNDGTTDLLCQKPEGATTTPPAALSMNATATVSPDLIASVTLPSGGVVTPTYTPATLVPGAVNLAGASYPFIPNTNPQSIVTKLTYTDAGNPQYSQPVVRKYEYSNRLLFRGDTPSQSKDLGFRLVTEIDEATGARTETTFKQGLDDYGMVERIVRKDSTGATISEIVYGYTDARVIGPGIKFIAPNRQTTKLYDGSSSPGYETSEEYDYDDYGNVKLVRQNGDASQFDDKEIVTDWAINTGPWVMKPSRVVVMSYKPGNGMTLDRETLNYYDGNALGYITKGLLTKTQALNDGVVGATVTFSYDSYGNLVKSWDPNANAASRITPTMEVIYDDATKSVPKLVYNAKRHTTTMSYDLALRPLQSVDANGMAITTVYDVFGRVIKSIAPYDTATSPTVLVEYFDNASPQYIKETKGGIVSYSYFDGFGRLIQTKRPSATGGWITTDTYYDASGRPFRVSVPYSTSSSAFSRDTSQKYVETVYDAADRPLCIIKPDGTKREMVYAQNTIFTIDENRHVTSNTVKGNKAFFTQYLGVAPINADAQILASMTVYRTITMESGWRTSKVIDAQGNVSLTTYDGLGRKIAYSDSTFGLWSFGYDANGNLISRTNAKGETILYIYDELNRILLKDYAIGADVIYSYDEAQHGASIGRLTSVSYAAGGDSYVYDGRGRITSATRTLDGKAMTQTWTYDSLDRVTTIRYPNGELVAQVYGADGQLVSVNGSSQYVSGITYDPQNRITGMTFGNGVSTIYDYYDTAGEIDTGSGLSYSYRLKSISAGASGSILNFNYTYDKVGNVLSKSDAINTPYSQSFDYDDINRLTSVTTIAAGTQTFSYDTLDRFVAKEGRTYTYGIAGKPYQVSSDGTYSYSYDANGNMTNRSDGRVISWDAEGRVTGVSDGGSFDYGAGYERVKKTENGVTTYYFFPEYTEDWKDGALTSYTMYYFENGIRIAQRSSTEGLQYIHSDHLNSSSVLTDENGTLVRRQGYDPYGEEAYATGTKTTDYTFTGYEKDTGGLLYANARYYDPELGLFISGDPLALMLDFGVAVNEGTAVGDVNTAEYLNYSINFYTYCSNNPVKYTDPTGMVVETAWDAFNAALDVYSFVMSMKDGRYLEAALDLASLLYDGFSTATPGLPGGTGAGKLITKLTSEYGDEAAEFVLKYTDDIAGLMFIVGNSKKLGSALEAAGYIRKSTEAAHHIVAGGSRFAKNARKILAKFGIDINSAVNGVFLDKSLHAKLHTKEYYEMVENLLKDAKTKEDAIQILQQIAETLKSME